MLGEALAILFPNAIPNVDYVIQDDGTGQEIIMWNLQESQPTQAELDNAYLTSVKQDKIRELSERCNQEIIAGFTSHNHQFAYDITDQINLLEKYTFVKDNILVLTVDWETKDAGIVTFSKVDFLEIVNDGSSHKHNQLQHFRTKKNAVNACTTIEQVQAITW